MEQISLIIFFEVVERKSAQPAYAFRLHYIFLANVPDHLKMKPVVAMDKQVLCNDHHGRILQEKKGTPWTNLYYVIMAIKRNKF